MRLFKTLSSLAILTMLAFSALGAIIETTPLIVSNGTKTVAISTNGTILLNNVDIKQVMTNTTLVPLSSTNLGTEGISLIGAQGGYNLKQFLHDTAVRGITRDKSVWTYSISPASNLVVSWTTGDMYDPEYGYYHLIAGSNTLVNNSLNIAYFDAASAPTIMKWTSGSRPESPSIVVVASFTVEFGMIIQGNVESATTENILETEDASFALFPSLIANGCNVFASGTGLTNIQASSGIEYYEQSRKVVHPSFNLASSGSLLYVFGHQNTNWTYFTTNQFPIGLWDNGTNMVSMKSTNWYRGSFLLPPMSNQLYYVLPNAAYTDSLVAAVANDSALPPGMSTYIPLVTSYTYAGSDTVLRTESSYWIDRRMNPDNLRKTSSSAVLASLGGGGTTPTLNQVLSAGNGTGGILPDGMGDPTANDQAANKHYVDSKINNINSGKAYVDPAGNDTTAILDSSILTFKTIQAAINASLVVANDTNRYTIVLSGGTYNEDVLMKNYIGIKGQNIQDTIIKGSITYPPTYTDRVGSEISLLTISSTNKPALVLNSGSDNAYSGVRSCYLTTSYDNPNITNKTVILIQRGISKIYGTTYNELFINTTNGIQCHVAIFEHSTDLANQGLSEFTSFNSSSYINCLDTNDVVSMAYTHDNTDAGCINQLMNGSLNIHLEDSAYHNNRIELVCHERAQGRTLSMGNASRLYMNPTNDCNLLIANAKNGLADNVAIVRNNHIRIVSGSSSNIWYGGSTGTNDNIRIYDTEIIQNNAFNYYPKRYAAEGSLGGYYLNTPHQNGDHIFGGYLDLSAVNSFTETVPESGHLKLYVDSTSGFERPYFTDSKGNKVRIGRDSVWTVYNAEATTLNQGELVYLVPGLSGTTQYAKRARGTNVNTCAFAFVVAVGGIPAGERGLVNRLGRIESGIDTSYCSQNDKMYLSATTAGAFTNVSPTGNNIAQFVGWCQVASTNGSINIQIEPPDTLGNLTPSKYTTYNNPVFSGSLFAITNSGVANFSVDNVPVGTTNTYILPVSGGLLATYTDVQTVPVSVSVGEPSGVRIGRVVYQSGVVNGRPQVMYSDRRDTSKLPVIGITMSAGNFGDIIQVINFGPLNGIDTSQFVTNDLIYLGTNGFLSTQSAISTDAIVLLGTCMNPSVNGSMLVNMRSYILDGAFNGSMRYTVKNASLSNNASAQIQAVNNNGYRIGIGVVGTNSLVEANRGFIYHSGYGSFTYNNAGKQRFLWTIDMQDLHDDRNYNNWPMMALVPQNSIYSNSFLGIGTTNPLAMLHVMGSGIFTNQMTAYQSFRTKVNGYSPSELITYDDTTNIVTISSNALYVANTNLSQRIVNETNRAIQAEAGLQSQIDSSTNRILNIENQTSTWNTAAINATNAWVNRVSGLEGRTSVWNTSSTVSIDATNRILSIENRTSTWNTASINATNAQAIANIALTNLNATIISSTNGLWISTTNLVTGTSNALRSAISANTNTLEQVLLTGSQSSQNIFLTNATSVVAIGSTSQTSAKLYVKGNNGSLTNSPLVIIEGSVGRNTDFFQINGNSGSITNFRVAKDGSWYQDGTIVLSNKLLYSGGNLVLTNVTGTGSSSIRFKANIGNANITYPTGPTIVPYTNIVLAASGGSIYSNGTNVCQWWPKATSGIVKFFGSWDAATANGVSYIFQIYKNGVLYATVIRLPGNNWSLGQMGWTWTFIDTATPSVNDYWQIYNTFSTQEASITAGTNNWIYGEVTP